MLEIEQITRTYPAGRRAPARRALDGASLTLDEGEWVALLGPNGSGKSTLVRVLSTLDHADSGSIRSIGDSLDNSRAIRAYRERLGVVFQHPGLDKLLTVRENLRAQGALHGLSGAGLDARIVEVSEMLRIDDRLDDRVGTLSGGLARRSDLARTLLTRPSLLILDEATGGLDHDSRMGFLGNLDSLRADADEPLTVLMTTHHMDEAERADRVLLMHGGRIVRDGTPDELRRAVGGATVRCGARAPGANEALSHLGLRAEVRSNELVAHAADDADLAGIAASLARAGVAFTISPPTLGDAYLDATGESLLEHAEGAA